MAVFGDDGLLHQATTDIPGETPQQKYERLQKAANKPGGIINQVKDGLTGGATDTTQLRNDTADARAQRDTITQRLDQPGPAAPTIEKTNLAPVHEAQTPYTGPAATVDRTTLGTGARQTVSAPQVGTNPAVAAQNVTAPGLGTAAQAKAATVADATRAYSFGAPGTTNANAAGVQRVDPVAAAKVGTVTPAQAAQVAQTQIQTSASDQIRAKQLGITNVLEQGALGTGGPTAADAELQLAQDRARRQQLGLAVSRAHGGNAGLAMREAAENISQAETEAGANAAALRAKEQQDAQARLIQTLEGTRGQDIGLATTQAGLTSQANLTDAQLANTTSLANLDVNAKQALTQAQLEQEARQQAAERTQRENLTIAANKQAVNLANAGAANEASRLSYSTETAGEEALQARQQQRVLANAANQQQVNIANTLATNERDVTRAGQAIDVGKANQAANLAANTTNANLKSTENIAGADLTAKVAMDNAQRELTALQAQAQLDQTRGIHNADLEQQIAIKQAELASATSQFNANAANTSTIAQGQITSGENKAQLDAQTAAAGQGIQRELGLVSAANTATSNVLGADTGEIGIQQGDKSRDAAFYSSVLGAGASVLGAKSDERAKKNITEILGKDGDDSDELLEAFDAIRPYRFEYKRPQEAGANAGPQVGVMAQDLEKTPVGKTIVTRDGNGDRMIELGPAVSLALAGIADMKKRMDAMKQTKGRR